MNVISAKRERNEKKEKKEPEWLERSETGTKSYLLIYVVENAFIFPGKGKILLWIYGH